MATICKRALTREAAERAVIEALFTLQEIDAAIAGLSGAKLVAEQTFRDIWTRAHRVHDAGLLAFTVELTCPVCRHVRGFDPYAPWWLFDRALGRPPVQVSKRFHCDRIAEQMSRAPDVIAVQGAVAVAYFADLLLRASKGGS